MLLTSTAPELEQKRQAAEGLPCPRSSSSASRPFLPKTDPVLAPASEQPENSRLSAVPRQLLAANLVRRALALGSCRSSPSQRGGFLRLSEQQGCLSSARVSSPLLPPLSPTLGASQLLHPLCRCYFWHPFEMPWTAALSTSLWHRNHLINRTQEPSTRGLNCLGFFFFFSI